MTKLHQAMKEDDRFIKELQERYVIIYFDDEEPRRKKTKEGVAYRSVLEKNIGIIKRWRSVKGS